MAYGNAGSQRVGHRAFRVRERTASEAVQTVRSAEPLGRIADPRRAAPKLGGVAVVADEQTLAVADIDGGRQEIEEAVRQFQEMRDRGARLRDAETCLLVTYAHDNVPQTGLHKAQSATRVPGGGSSCPNGNAIPS